MSDSLFTEPQRDEFTSESPIRAFTTWAEHGVYAVGKGFRPSVQHLGSYLDAMECKENWRTLQVLDAGNGLTILFRRAGVKIMPSPFAKSVGEPIRTLEETITIIAENLGTSPERMMEDFILRGAARTEDEPYVNEERMARFTEAAEKIDAAEKIADKMDELPRYHLKLYGFNAEKIRRLMDQSTKDIFEVIIGENKSLDDLDLSEGWIFTGWKENNVAVFERTRPAVAPYQPDREYSLYDTKCLLPEGWEAEEPQPVVRFGEGSGPATLEWSKPAHKHQKPAVQAVKVVIQDDPVNPKHYAGRACADIGEHLSANSYQVLKYCWRLGKKDEALVELGKSLWYLDSERSNPMLRLQPRDLWPMGGRAKWFNFCAERTVGQSPLVQNLVNALSRWSFDADSRYLQVAKDAIEGERDRLIKADCGSGLAIT